MKFHSVVEPHEPMRGLVVSPDAVEYLERASGTKRPRITVTINGHTWHTRLAIMRGRHLIGFSNANRAATAAEVGDEVVIDVEVDDTPDVVETPTDVTDALQADPSAQARFDALTTSQRRQHIRLIDQAKSTETRARRIAALVQTLRG
ncbi:YdeI/OmpD-associated family protein [Leifsonia sp. NPDC058292]|uniref:YdeI/OmpD-associated family protein n=1 Tax=Leifsonia sp. NPDC058292 TaxID=3346428 RepID=UPI0036DA4B39